VNLPISSEALVVLLAIAALFGFGKNIVEATLRLHAYGETKSGQATLLVVCVALCLATLVIVLVRP
jgi:hypothetical protein